MNSERELLYNLLPEFHRNRDYYQGEPLRAFLRIFEEPVWTAHEAIGRLYDDWFIETCEDGAVPLIGELLGLSVHPDTLAAIPQQRGLVANGVADRQRKGTLGALQAVLRDATGWGVRVVESARLVGDVGALGDAGAAVSRTVGLRGERTGLGDAFDARGHLVGLRSDPTERTAKYGVATVDVFVWRAQARRFVRAEPQRVAPGHYRFCPLGLDAGLFSPFRPPRTRYAAVGPDSAPVAISRGALAAEIAARRVGEPAETAFLGESPALLIETRTPEGAWSPVGIDRLWVQDLSGWIAPGAFPAADAVVVDPELGRFALAADFGKGVRVAYAARWDPVPPFREDLGTEEAADAVPPPGPSALAHALLREGGAGRVELAESAFYRLPSSPIRLAAGETLTIKAAPGARPVLVGRLHAACPEGSAALRLRGVVVEGLIEVEGGVRLDLSNCVVPPRAGVVGVTGRAQGTEVPTLRAVGCVLGALRWAAAAEVMAEGCVIDGEPAMGGVDGGTGPRLTIRDSTVLGRAEVYALLLGSGVLFRDPVQAVRVDEGSLRFSYAPEGSRLPAAAHCLIGGGPRLRPAFFSTRFGHVGYAELARPTPAALARGGERGDEIGVFGPRRDRLREAEMRRTLQEFLPFGLEAQIVDEE